MPRRRSMPKGGRKSVVSTHSRSSSVIAPHTRRLKNGTKVRVKKHTNSSCTIGSHSQNKKGMGTKKTTASFKKRY